MWIPGGAGDSHFAKLRPSGIMATSPTQLSLKIMRGQGYTCAITEHWNAFDRKRHDLFGFIDLLCIRKNEVVGIQTTSASNVSARVKKITSHENVGFVRDAGIQIFVHGWAKNTKGRWTLSRCIDLS